MIWFAAYAGIGFGFMAGIYGTEPPQDDFDRLMLILAGLWWPVFLPLLVLSK